MRRPKKTTNKKVRNSSNVDFGRSPFKSAKNMQADHSNIDQNATSENPNRRLFVDEKSYDQKIGSDANTPSVKAVVSIRKPDRKRSASARSSKSPRRGSATKSKQFSAKKALTTAKKSGKASATSSDIVVLMKAAHLEERPTAVEKGEDRALAMRSAKKKKILTEKRQKPVFRQTQQRSITTAAQNPFLPQR